MGIDMFGFFRACSSPHVCSCECAGQQRAPCEGASTTSPWQKVETPTLFSEKETSRVAAHPRKDKGRRRTLSVPTSFNRFQISMIYTHLGATQGTLMEQQRTMLHAILRSFTKELTRGVELMILNDDGKLAECYLLLDRRLKELSVHAEDTKKVVELSRIIRVCAPEENRNIHTTNQHFIDELCATLVLQDSQFITFRFDSIATREYFSTCLHVLRMAQETAHDWYT